MTPLEIFGAKVLRAWWENDCMDVQGDEIYEIAERSGITILEKYEIAKHGKYMNIEWDCDEGDKITVLAPGISDLIGKAHKL